MSLYKVVLLIDDDKEDQEIFSDAIKEVDKNIRILGEFNSDQVVGNLNLMKENRPEIIFLDMNMPRLNGKQLLSDLKSDPKIGHIPVVMCSTFFGEADVREITRLGAVHYMVKPTRFIDLCQTIAKILHTRW